MGCRDKAFFAIMGGRFRVVGLALGLCLTSRPPDACGGGFVGRESNLAAGAGDVFRWAIDNLTG